jgi:hypothetical protein
VIVQYATTQFTKAGLIHFDEKWASFAATDAAVFSDAYLQGILFGLILPRATVPFSLSRV